MCFCKVGKQYHINPAMESSSYSGEKQLLPLSTALHFPCPALPPVLWIWHCKKLGSCRSALLSQWLSADTLITSESVEKGGGERKWLAQFIPHNVPECDLEYISSAEGGQRRCFATISSVFFLHTVQSVVFYPHSLKNVGCISSCFFFAQCAFLTFSNLSSLSPQMMLWQVSCPNCSMRSKSAGTGTTPSRSSATPSPPTPWTVLGAGGSLTRSALTDPTEPLPESARYSSVMTQDWCAGKSLKEKSCSSLQGLLVNFHNWVKKFNIFKFCFLWNNNKIGSSHSNILLVAVLF